jgi:hypothetical protein
MCNLSEFDRDDLNRELSLYAVESPEYREIANAISTRDAIAYAIEHVTQTEWAEIRPQHVSKDTDMTTTNTAPVACQHTDTALTTWGHGATAGCSRECLDCGAVVPLTNDDREFLAGHARIAGTTPFVLGAGYGVGITTPAHTIDAVIDAAYFELRDASSSTTVTLEYRQARKPVGATVTVTYAPENYGVPGKSWLSVDTNSVDGYRYIAAATHRRINNGICAMLAIHAIEYSERADVCSEALARLDEVMPTPDETRAVLADNSAAPGTDAIGAGIPVRDAECTLCGSKQYSAVFAALDTDICSDCARKTKPAPFVCGYDNGARTAPCEAPAPNDASYCPEHERMRALPLTFGAGYGVGIAVPDTEHDLYADVRVCEPFGRAVGQAYMALPTRDNSQRVTDAYDAFRREIMRQYDALPVRVTVVDSDPYASAADMFADVRTGRLFVLSSATTGGHPYLTDDENNAFRAVHDFHGHYMSGRDFSRHGEDAAYLRHSLMFSRQACRALTMETRGQNSAFIFEHGGRDFPEQKLGLLPRWCETRKPHVFGALWNSTGTGATVDQTGQAPTAGYAVAYGPGIVVRDSEFTPDILAEFLRVEYAPFYGLWRHNGHVFLDTVLVVGDELTARTLARQFDQIAFHDIGTATDIYL